MPGRERKMWMDLRPQLMRADPTAHIERIENAAALGTPDVTLCWYGVEAWIELKCIARFPRDPLAIVKIDHYTRNQQLWQRARGRAGGRVFLLLRVDGPTMEWLLFGWQAAFKYVGRIAADNLRSRAACRFIGSKIDPDVFRFAISLLPDRTPP